MARWQLFVRHAHRDTHDRSLDNGLSDKGRTQCDKLVRSLSARKPPLKPEKILSSPKLRCIDTAMALARWARVEVVVDARLDEQAPGESTREFEKRVKAFLERFEDEGEVAFVSHGDVLALAAHHYGSRRDDLKKGDYFCVREELIELFNGVST